MRGLEIHPLSELRDEAARLLAERYSRQRAAEPLLPEVDDFAPHVAFADGLVATRGGEAVAYLAGEVEGDTVRVGFAGCAASEPEALRDAFAALAGDWDVSRFAVAIPAAEPALVDPFFRLAFGCQFVWAIRETEASALVDFGGTIRPGSRQDLEAAAAFDEDLILLQAASPSFSGLELPPREEMLAEWTDTWEGQAEYTHFVAELNGRVVGQALLYARPEGGLRVPPGNVDLAHAEVREELRGRGIGLALTAHVLRYAHEQGFRSLTTDWRSVNLLSSRFWPRRGFRPQYLRLYRAVP
jgi:GNAT superfamily N-acetyltransferase